MREKEFLVSRFCLKIVHRIGNGIILPNEILFYLTGYAIANDERYFLVGNVRFVVY